MKINIEVEDSLFETVKKAAAFQEQSLEQAFKKMMGQYVKAFINVQAEYNRSEMWIDDVMEQLGLNTEKTNKASQIIELPVK